MGLLLVAAILEMAMLALPANHVAGARGDGASLLPSPVQVLGQRAAEQGAAVAQEVERRAEALAQAGVVMDGQPLSADQARALVVASPQEAPLVQAVDQRTVLVSGCEVIALASILQSQGYDADPLVIARDHITYGTRLSTEYLGKPDEAGGGFPHAIVQAANSWLGAEGAQAQAVNLTGTGLEGALALVQAGYPVALWVTQDMQPPVLTGAVIDGLRWYDREHCVVAYGVQGDEVLVADSLVGDVRRSVAELKAVYEACGKLSVAVLPYNRP